VAFEVLRVRSVAKVVASFTRAERRAYDAAVSALRGEGCAAGGKRLLALDGTDYPLCQRALYGSWRMTIAFREEKSIVIVAIARAIEVAFSSDSEFSAEAHQGAVDALTPGSALLVVKRGPNAGSRFLLDQDVTTAGRHPDSDIFLDDVTVSRRHAEFRREGSGYTVHDVGSLNGTYVNRERIDAAPLSGGDEVQIGKFRLVYLNAAVRAGAGAQA